MEFVLASSSGPQKFLKIDTEVDRVYTDLELEPDRRTIPSLRGVQGTAKSGLSSQQVRAALGEQKRKQDEDPAFDKPDSVVYPAGFSARYGGLAVKYGVAVSDPPGYIAFGNTITAIADNVTHDPSDMKCVADVAPGDKDKWCPLGKDKCPRRGAKHSAPPSLDPENMAYGLHVSGNQGL